jgi:hypothetical protein
MSTNEAFRALTRRVGDIADVSDLSERVALAVIAQAAEDARDGSVEALAWLALEGSLWAAAMSEGAGAAALAVVEQALGEIADGALVARYPVMGHYAGDVEGRQVRLWPVIAGRGANLRPF